MSENIFSSDLRGFYNKEFSPYSRIPNNFYVERKWTCNFFFNLEMLVPQM